MIHSDPEPEKPKKPTSGGGGKLANKLLCVKGICKPTSRGGCYQTKLVFKICDYLSTT